jgi:hypothetical protein
MNLLSRKLHLLEKNVLPELPKEGTTKITWDNGDPELDQAENQLHRRASQILDSYAKELQQAADRGETTCTPLSPDDQAIVDAANHRFMARVFEIFQIYTDAFVTLKDPMANWVFYTRFYWLIEETRKFKQQFDAEIAVFQTPGYWELCEGEQEKLLAPVYTAWNHDLFTPESFQRYCEQHHIFKTTEEIQQLNANRTPEQARQEELDELQEEKEEKVTAERNSRYLKEKCPTCKEKCNWYKKNTQNGPISQLAIMESPKI